MAVATSSSKVLNNVEAVRDTLYEALKNDDRVVILGEDVGARGNVFLITKDFAKEFGINFPVLPDAENRVTDLYHVLPIPTSFFVDKDGIIRDIQVGPVDRPLLEKWLLGKF